MVKQQSNAVILIFNLNAGCLVFPLSVTGFLCVSHRPMIHLNSQVTAYTA